MACRLILLNHVFKMVTISSHACCKTIGCGQYCTFNFIRADSRASSCNTILHIFARGWNLIVTFLYHFTPHIEVKRPQVSRKCRPFCVATPINPTIFKSIVQNLCNYPRRMCRTSIVLVPHDLSYVQWVVL